MYHFVNHVLLGAWFVNCVLILCKLVMMIFDFGLLQCLFVARHEYLLVFF